MNKRLELIAELIPDGRGFADVGTDHGYLPAYKAKNGYSGKIIASDIHAAPLQSALATARAEGVAERISFRLCDGLEDCRGDEIDTIVIAGMGGDTICGILDRAEWCMDSGYLLLLQPMTKAEVVRYWLTNNGFGICAEHLLSDGGEYYQVISARYGMDTPLTDAELFTGPYTLAVQNALFPAQLDALIRRFEKARDGISCAKRDVSWQQIHAQILSQLIQMREEKFDEKSK